MPAPAKYVQPVHFEDFDGAQFERLVFAYHARAEKWRSLEWYGQTGSDLGRDIWGVHDGGETTCIQCVNRGQFTFAKAETDLSKVLQAGNGTPQRFRYVTRSAVSAKMRDRIRAHVLSRGVHECDIWSGAEFEEFLRRDTESLLKRFVEGEVFPDAVPDLLVFGQEAPVLNDEEALAMMAKLFDRPAFYTPIHQESNLGDFKQAITDTIQALGTGIWKSRDGNVIGKIHSRQQLKDDSLRRKVRAVEMALAKLRARFDELVRSGIVKHCSCSDPRCPVYFMPAEAAHDLERLRRDALNLFRGAHRDFEEPVW